MADQGTHEDEVAMKDALVAAFDAAPLGADRWLWVARRAIELGARMPGATKRRRYPRR